MRIHSTTMMKSSGSVATAAWPCDAIIERSYEFLDGELSADADVLVREHLATCDSCRCAVRRDQAFLACLERRARLDAASPELRERIADVLAHDEPSRRSD